MTPLIGGVGNSQTEKKLNSERKLKYGKQHVSLLICCGRKPWGSINKGIKEFGYAKCVPWRAVV